MREYGICFQSERGAVSKQGAGEKTTPNQGENDENRLGVSAQGMKVVPESTGCV
jgi:hypothetical protein